MKFLVDAQLPRHMCAWLAEFGQEAIHAFDLAQGNRTTDDALIECADAEGRVLVTKDNDFVQSRLLRGRPRFRWLIAIGNADNRRLESMVRSAMPLAQKAFATGSFIELGPDRLTVRE